MEVLFSKIGDVEDKELKFAVICALYNGKWVFAKHKQRDTWEIPGGHREIDEDINDTARRELYEETGAIKFKLEPICDYICESTSSEVKGAYGRLFYAEIEELGELPDSEMGEVRLFDEIPERLTYPDIYPHLYKRVCIEMEKFR